MALVAIVPVAHEASDGRIVVAAPAATDRIDVTVSGVRARVRVVAKEKAGGRLRITVQISAIARTGAELELVARDGTRNVGRAVVNDVHLLGSGAFAGSGSRRLIATSDASAEALRIAAAAGGQIGISAECRGTGRTAAANARHVAVAASTLKVAILAAALGRDRGSPTRPQTYGSYRDAIIPSSNEAANVVLARVGGGSSELGARRVNALMASLQMRDSFLDGPYRLSGGPSRKRTSAADLVRLARAVYQAAGGTGPLARLGVSRHEARVLIGLMAVESYPGLIRDHVRGPVAHKAGWLGAVQNDLALAFGTPGGTCLIGLTTEGLSFAAASSVGRQVADRVLPLLARPPPPGKGAATPSSSSQHPPAGESLNRADGFPWRWFAGGMVVLAATAALAGRFAVVHRRRGALPSR
jgi:hypothetical protein